MPDQFQKILANLQGFGARRLAIMAAVAALVMTVIGVASVYLNKPAYDTLYVGLERSDVNQIGLVLGEAGIGFDVGSDGTTVLVPAGKTAAARMLLAEKGLPTSANAGYELFDNVGSLGLTSFMQQITRVRALEGEIARTIQSINGIRAARVHIVMSERANFRREEQQPSASVVIRAADVDAVKSATSIRYLVAAAVPGPRRRQGDRARFQRHAACRRRRSQQHHGQPLARRRAHRRDADRGQHPPRAGALSRAGQFPRQRQGRRQHRRAPVRRDDLRSRIRASSARSRWCAPTRTPTRTTRRRRPPSTRTCPRRETPATGGPQSTAQSERKEETTNYEMNSKKISTVSNGYTMTKMSIAVVVNQKRLADILGKDATPEKIAERIAEIQKVVSSAAGLDEARGDQINVSAVEFIDGLDGVPFEAPGIMDKVGEQVGTMINAGAFIVVVFLLAFFGLRPMVAALGKSDAQAALAGPSFDEMQRSLPGPENGDGTGGPQVNALAGRRRQHRHRRPAPEAAARAAGAAGAHGRPQ